MHLPIPPPEELLLVPLNASNQYESLQIMGKHLVHLGYVKESFVPAVIEREKRFPTGLPIVGCPVAIPHTDAEHCIKPGIALAILKSPVSFIEMGSNGRTLPVKLIFMLSLPNPDIQVKALQELINLFQTKGFLKNLQKAEDPNCAIQIFNKILYKYKNK